jgi:N-acetylneuraminic acid mutarotase
MSQKNLIIMLWFLIQLLVEINCQFIPKKRNGHTATLIDNKLYILSGKYGPKIDDISGKDFFYLDVSVSFDTQNLLWKDLSNFNTVPPHHYAAYVVGGENNNTLFLYGGANDTMMDLVYIFNPQSNSWSIPTITGDIPNRKCFLTGIIDQKGFMYLWGGLNDEDDYTEFYNDMLILDTKNFIWRKGSLIGAPTARRSYGATLLPDNKIIYIGKHVIPVFPILFIIYS